MADFKLTTFFAVPVGSTVVDSGGTTTSDLTAGQVGFFDPSYAPTDGTGSPKYIYVAQGRQPANRYLQASKRSDKIAKSKVKEWFKVTGNPVAANEVWKISDFNVKCGEVVTITLRAHSSYIDTLYFNGFTRSVTVQAPCCDCGADPCDVVDQEALVDDLICAFEKHAPGINADNISFSTFFTFHREGTGASSALVISGKPLTKYGQPCDIAAFPYEYDRMWFRTFVYTGPATTADYIVPDACNTIATVSLVQRSSYPTGTAEEMKQLEKNYYSYQAGYLKHLYRMNGYNANFESYVEDGTTYDYFYVEFADYEIDPLSTYNLDNAIIIVAESGSQESTDVETVLTNFLGAPVDASGDEVTTTSTTTVAQGDCTVPDPVIP